MSHLDEWVHLIANQLKSEAELVGAQAKSELYEDAARDTFVRIVLEPFLPGNYAIGSGKIIDATGAISQPQDIVIYRNDYPQFNMPGRHNVFIYESVLATVQVRSKLIRKSFFSAMEQCASLAMLNPMIEAATRRAMAEKMKMQMDANQQYVHPDPIHTGRFNLISRVPSFIYAFTGYQTSEKQLAENLNKWIDIYHEDHDALQMKSLPSVIATQGCFAWRNNAPFAFKQRSLMGVGNDSAPLRLIILQLLQALNRRLQHTSDGYGIKSTIAPYLAHFKPPKFSELVGAASNPGDKKPAAVSKPAVNPVATNQQPEEKIPTPAEKTQPAEQTAAETPQPQTSATQAARDYSQTSTSEAPKKDAEQAVQTISEAPDTQSDQQENEPVIEDLSLRQPNKASASSNPSQEPNPSAKPSTPLSFYSDGTDQEDVDEYKFDPIEPKKPVTSEQDEETNDNSFLETQVIDTTKSTEPSSKSNDDLERTQEIPNSLAGQQKEDDSNDPLMDTVVDSKETIHKIKPDSRSKNSEYVTESLI